MSTAESVPLLVARLRATAEAGQVEQALTACRDRLVADAASVELWDCWVSWHCGPDTKRNPSLRIKKRQRFCFILAIWNERSRYTDGCFSMCRKILIPSLRLDIHRQLVSGIAPVPAYELLRGRRLRRGEERENRSRPSSSWIDMSEHNVGATHLTAAEQYVRAGFPEEGIRELRISAVPLRQANRLEEYGQVVDDSVFSNHRNVSSLWTRKTPHQVSIRMSVPLHPLLAKSRERRSRGVARPSKSCSRRRCDPDR